MFKKMFRNVPWKKILRLTFLVFVAAGFVLTVSFTESRQHEMLCTELNIEMHNLPNCEFIDKNDVEQLIQDKFGLLIGTPVHTINISLLENIIRNNPFVSRAEVFSTVDGKLNIDVIPRNPIVRIINLDGESFYIDEEGVFMPLSEKYSASVPLASGFIPGMKEMQEVRTANRNEMKDTSFHPLTIEKVFMLARYLEYHDFWNEQVQQVYVNQDGEMELVPRVGNQTIVFGDEKEMDEKFNKLFMFYQEGLSKQGWNKYNVINLKYKDQVVCTKKTTNGK